MFDKSTKVNLPDTLKLKIKEYRAPTDDSIRLFKEFTEKAEQNLVKTIRVQGNHIVNGAILVFYKMMRDEWCLEYVFELNGKRFSFREDLTEDPRPKINCPYKLHEWHQKLYTRVAEEIAAQLVSTLEQSQKIDEPVFIKY